MNIHLQEKFLWMAKKEMKIMFIRKMQFTISHILKILVTVTAWHVKVKKELLFIAGEDAVWFDHFGKQYEDSKTKYWLETFESSHIKLNGL